MAIIGSESGLDNNLIFFQRQGAYTSDLRRTKTIFKLETGTSPQDCIVVLEEKNKRKNPVKQKSGTTRIIKKFVDTQLTLVRKITALI